MARTRIFTVLGPTGAQGAPVVARLLADGHRVRAAARDVRAIRTRWGDRVEAVALDLASPASVAEALAGADGAFLHLPLPAGIQQAMANAAGLVEGVARASPPVAVYTTSGPGFDALTGSQAVDAGRRVVAALLGTGTPIVVLRPTLYLGNLHQPDVLAQIRDGVLAYPPVSADRPLSWTDHDDQAAIAVAALLRPDLAGTVTDIATPGPLTGLELAGAIAAASGRPLRYAPLTPAGFGEQLGRTLGNPGLGAVIAEMYAAIGSLPPDGAVVDTRRVEERFGIRLPTTRERIAASRW